jgi:hypothetical protein
MDVMNGLTLFLLLCAAVGAVLLCVWVWGRRSARTDGEAPVKEAATLAKLWGVRIHAPASEHTCPHVREFLEKEFTLETRPPLPLPDCPFPNQCACSYVKLFDRRRQSRRAGQERRQGGERFEQGKCPRRTGHDRRNDRLDWF